MTATEAVCPICGEQLVPEHSLHDATDHGSTWLGRCENHHWGLQSGMFGWIPIDPGVTAGDEMTTLEDAGPA
jgi:hypothetical protein